MIQALAQIIPPSRIRSRYIDLISYASDAGFYHLQPQAVVQPIDEEEIRALFRFAHEQRIPLVFRTAGTSLSGQSITDGILVDLSQHWNHILVEADGTQVRVQPGITGGLVNAILRKFQCKIGPDPASINAAMMGGILSNNASGMCCGVKLNSYHTTRYIRFMLPNGMVFTTEKPEDYERFATDCPDIFQTLETLRMEILDNSELYEKIRNKYRTKTTIGYSLNAFVDFQHPLDILAHLLIGAEGTLAFISEAVLQTVPDHPHKSTGLLYFPDIYAACQAIVPLTDAGAEMVELMDRASLRSVESMDGMPEMVKTLSETAAALLVEFQEPTEEQLANRVKDFLTTASGFSLIEAPAFTTDPTERAFLWKVRKGLFPAVGAVRQSGTTVILEDIAFPVDQLGDAILDIQQLFQQYDYSNGIIFGHAKDGNIHFVVTQALNTEKEIDRYDRFLRDVVELVVKKYNGTLKAEHGTGRNMAPFVETEWGDEAYRIMQTLKKVIDPENLLNPGVIINEDAQAHIQNLKEMPTVEAEVDSCTECGFCEHVCPSRAITTTPRRRIVARRALKTLHAAGDTANYQLLLQQYQYQGNDTCAVDGLCATACPVDINTGDLTKRLRREHHSPAANRIATWAARNFRTLERLARTGLKTGVFINRVFGKKAMARLTGLVKKGIPAFPLWSDHLQSPPDTSVLHAPTSAEGTAIPAIVYFPACISRTLGTYAGREKNIMETFLSICRKAGIAVSIPENIQGSCCSQIFSSKGFGEAYRFTADRIVAQLWRASHEGQIPVVTDVSSCAYTLQQLGPALSEERRAQFRQLSILDSVDFLHDYLLPRVSAPNSTQRIVLHPVCSLKKMKTEDKLFKVAQHFAAKVSIPHNAGCCGMAGDRGFLHPELTAAATQPEAAEVKEQHYDGYYSSTKTCEIALSESVQRNYESILYLVDEGIAG